MLPPQQDPVPGTTSPSPPVDTAQAEIWLAEHVQRAVQAHGTNDEVAMAEALQSLCGAARRANLPIERVLVLIKQIWQSRTADVALRGGPTDDRLARLVSACISRYYDRS